VATLLLPAPAPAPPGTTEDAAVPTEAVSDSPSERLDSGRIPYCRSEGGRARVGINVGGRGNLEGETGTSPCSPTSSESPLTGGNLGSSGSAGKPGMVGSLAGGEETLAGAGEGSVGERGAAESPELALMIPNEGTRVIAGNGGKVGICGRGGSVVVRVGESEAAGVDEVVAAVPAAVEAEAEVGEVAEPTLWLLPVRRRVETRLSSLVAAITRDKVVILGT